MRIVGLTGGIATGKSTVSALFAEQLLPIVDADKIAKQVVQKVRHAKGRVRCGLANLDSQRGQSSDETHRSHHLRAAGATGAW